ARDLVGAARADGDRVGRRPLARPELLDRQAGEDRAALGEDVAAGRGVLVGLLDEQPVPRVARGAHEHPGAAQPLAVEDKRELALGEPLAEPPLLLLARELSVARLRFGGVAAAIPDD